jgi:hypothetical protein
VRSTREKIISSLRFQWFCRAKLPCIVLVGYSAHYARGIVNALFTPSIESRAARLKKSCCHGVRCLAHR